jgi:hypothetical protein
VLTEGYIAVFLLGALAGGAGVYLACRPVFTQLQDRCRYWQKNAEGWEEQSAMRSKLLNAVLRLARDAGALDAVTGEDVPPRLTVVTNTSPPPRREVNT